VEGSLVAWDGGVGVRVTGASRVSSFVVGCAVRIVPGTLVQLVAIAAQITRERKASLYLEMKNRFFTGYTFL
jgi:hypothetical protein